MHDPIFAAIETTRRSHAAFEAAIHDTDAYDVAHGFPHDETATALDEKQTAAGDAYLDALETMIKTRPTTIAGIAALLEYVVEEPVREQIFTHDDTRGIHCDRVLVATVAAALGQPAIA
jgi:hypothetical protein